MGARASLYAHEYLSFQTELVLGRPVRARGSYVEKRWAQALGRFQLRRKIFVDIDRYLMEGDERV